MLCSTFGTLTRTKQAHATLLRCPNCVLCVLGVLCRSHSAASTAESVSPSVIYRRTHPSLRLPLRIARTILTTVLCSHLDGTNRRFGSGAFDSGWIASSYLINRP